MPNKRSQYFVILFKTFPLLLTLPSSSSATLFSADHGTPSVTLQNLLCILSICFHPPYNPHISIPYIILDSHNISYIFSRFVTLMSGVLAKHLSMATNVWLLFAITRSCDKPHFTKKFLIVLGVISLQDSGIKCITDNTSSFIYVASWSSPPFVVVTAFQITCFL
jgi:hypothetical protein